MARDTENILDDPQEEIEEKPQSLRESIKAAFDENREPDERDSDGGSERPVPGDKDTPRQRRAKSDTDTDGDVPSDKEGTDKAPKARAKREEADQKPVSGQKGEEKKEVDAKDIPPFYRNKGKSTWDKLSPEDRQTIVAREKEVSDGFQQVSQRIRAIEEIERVISPRLPMIQQLGITPVETVSRLFQWMDALQGPNRVQAFKDLAKSLGVDANQFASQQSQQSQQPDPTQVSSEDQPPSWFSEFTGAVDQRLAKVTQIEQDIANQKQAHAANTVTNWAKDKPHYQKVAPLMGQLLQAGIVGLKSDGSVDLDGAYEKAIKLDPEVAALIQQEAAAKATQEAEEKAQKEAKEKSDKLARARRAGSGLRPAPASGPSVLPNANARSANGKKDTSVRGSIRAAVEELRE